MMQRIPCFLFPAVACVCFLISRGICRADVPTGGGKVCVNRDETRIHLSNQNLTVEIDARQGTWDASWPGLPSTAIRRARFSAIADGRTLPQKTIESKVQPFSDKLGSGIEVRQTWGGKADVKVERLLCVYDGRPTATISGRIVNTGDREIRLGTVRMVDVSSEHEGRWRAGILAKAPAAIYYPSAEAAGLAAPCRPVSDEPDKDHDYQSTGVLAFSSNEPGEGGLVLGYIRAQEAAPYLRAKFRVATGGKLLLAESQFRDRILKPKKSLELGTVWISARKDPLELLPRYGDAMAALSDRPVRKTANSLWCTWWPVLSNIDEKYVLENAAVAARHFKPLGMDTIQLDHGWQRGEGRLRSGDWVANERFPHGIEWLAKELRSRYGMKLGLWLAPTMVTDETQVYKRHLQWLFADESGKPRNLNSRTYILDSSHPRAARWIEDTFARLARSGAAYFKIDFLSGGRPGDQPHDPQCVPQWGVYRRAVEAIRRGAGEDAWIRYTQAPPLLAVGWADSSMLSPDTHENGDGKRGYRALRINAQLMAASHWAHRRIFHREICDMNVGMKGDAKEARLRLALMSLSGCSTSYCDDFRTLTPARIRMMQQCLPPGGPAMTPLDLFERPIPSHWRIRCKTAAGEWDVLGVFNWSDEPCRRDIDLAGLGVSADKPAHIFEFWHSKPMGKCTGRLWLDLPALSSRILLIHRVKYRPQVIGTDMHVLGGYHELTSLEWNHAAHTLSGQCRRAPGLSGKLFINIPPPYRPAAEKLPANAALTHVAGTVWFLDIKFDRAESRWTVPFDLSPEE